MRTVLLALLCCWVISASAQEDVWVAESDSNTLIFSWDSPESESTPSQGVAASYFSTAFGNTKIELDGRRALQLQTPAVLVEQPALIVVSIWIDREGNVVRAAADRRASVNGNPVLYSISEKSATKTKWTPDPNAPAVQKGSITYRYEPAE